MTSGQTGTRLYQGALVTVAGQHRKPSSTIPFQFNPASLTRSFQPAMAGGEQGDRSQLVRYIGAPAQTIQVEIELDAASVPDQSGAGIAPLLATLELLAYPDLHALGTLESKAARGQMEVAPLAAPRLLFVWGPQRVLPVRIESLSITEEVFNPFLTPLRATVALSMRVLTYSDLSSDMSDYTQFKTYQANLAMLAQQLNTNPDLGYTPAIQVAVPNPSNLPSAAGGASSALSTIETIVEEAAVITATVAATELLSLL